MRKLFRFLPLLAFLLPVAASAQGLNPPANQSYVGGKFYARRYEYPGVRINSGGGAASTTYTINMSAGQVRLADGRTISPFSAGGFNILGQPGPYPAIPISVGAGTTQETVTPTAVVGCYNQAPQNTCQITAAFTYAHGAGELVTTGSAGIQEAINDAAFFGGGVVVVDGAANLVNGGASTVTADIAAANVMPTVAIEDTRGGVSRYWTPTPTGNALAVPTTLTAQAACDATHQFCSDATVAGSASYGSSLYGCVAYVDIMGNEGPCSLASTVFTSVASKAIDVAAPAASPGAVGYVVYLSLSGGSYAFGYQVPSTSSNCTLTTLETVTPACAVANTNYNQSASTFGADALFTKGGSQITTYPLTTAMSYPVLATTAQTLTAQHPLTNSSLTYAYAPSNRVGVCPGMSSANGVLLNSASAISGSSATTVPQPLVTWTVPSSCFNYIGAEFRVSGMFTYTDGGSGTSTIVTVSWDANGTNTTTVPLKLCQMNDTFTSVAGVDNVTFSCTAKVLSTGATGTVLAWGQSVGAIAAGATTLMRTSLSAAVAASGSVALNTNSRVSAMFEAVGATSNPGAQTIDATLEFLN